MAKSKLVKANKKIEETVVGGYKKIEDTVVGGYKKVESAVVGGYQKVEDAFVDQFLTHEGESVDEAKKRLQKEQAAREEAAEVGGTAGIPDSDAAVDIGRASVERSMEITRASAEFGRKKPRN